MKTRVIVSALTVAALSLGSVSSFAQGDWRNGSQQRVDQRRDYGQRFEQRQQGAWQRGADRGHYVRNVPPPAPAPAPDWRAQREWGEHQHRGYVQNRGSYYQQPSYVYAQPGYYEQPGSSYQQPQYYGQYDDGGNAADIVLGAIVGGVIAQAIVNSR